MYVDFIPQLLIDRIFLKQSEIVCFDGLYPVVVFDLRRHEEIPKLFDILVLVSI